MPVNSQSGTSVAVRDESKVRFLDVPVDRVTTPDVLSRVKEFMNGNRVHQIATVNPEFVMKAQTDLEFKAILEEAELCIPDGIGLVLAGYWKRQRLPERVAGSDLVYRLAKEAAVQGWKLFLLGAAPGVAEEARDVLLGLYPRLQIAGTYAGSPNMAEDNTSVALINKSQAELLYVAYGAPGQDKWIARNRERLTTVKVAMGIGGSLDFISGRVPRAPIWLQRLGLEWLYRLYKEPWRWRRMLALPRFALLILKE